jgi:septum formation protein
MGLNFEVIPSSFDESGTAVTAPNEYVMELASQKARDIARGIDDGIIIGADTVVVVDGEILGKPIDPADARRMLRLLSGRSHSVLTGVCVIQMSGGREAHSSVAFESTRVFFAPLTNEIIDAYVATGEPLDKAGAYGIQERGCVLIERIEGDYFNVVGLPVYRVSRMLMEIGVPLFG